MSIFHRLRLHRTALWGRMALLWFMTALLTAAAAPMVHHYAVMQVHPAAEHGHHAGDSPHTPRVSHLECPLCMPLDAPPPVLPSCAQPPLPLPLRQAGLALLAARIASLTGAPLPARGPPPPLV